jgi:tetratricopeptide (TPR) repeat protein
MPHINSSKNIVLGNITAGGNVHIGDIIYNIELDFQSGSILFLRFDKVEGNQYLAHLSVKSKHSTQGTLATSGERWYENIEVDLPPQLFDEIEAFQAFRRGVGGEMRYKGMTPNPSSVAAAEDKLGRLIFNTFFSGIIGQACADFIGLLREQRIEELLLAIACEEAALINVPFEMALPHFFGTGQTDFGPVKFGLVRTKAPSLARFDMQGRQGNAAPLKMLFVTALPEDATEGSKMLQIEEEQSRLIRAIGSLEATGDKKPKIVIEFLENAALDELDKALTTRHHDIVHISGHGVYKHDEEKGVLFFENDEGDEVQISGAALGKVLEKHACVKLLILSACETAIAGAEGGVTGQVADSVPTVVAMRFAVTDEGAKVFTTALYTHLAKGDTMTQSVAYARTALQTWVAERRQNAPQLPHISEWFTPVVYQNQFLPALMDTRLPYHLPDDFYPQSSFLKTKHSRLIGEGFIGRKGYLIRMRLAFRAGKHVVLQGLGGLGKTTLAEAFAHHYDNHSHEVVIFRGGSQTHEKHILDSLNKRLARHQPDLSAQIQEIIDSPDAPLHDKLQYLIDNYLRHRRIILIFDNFEDVQQDEAGNLQGAIASEALSQFLQYFCQNTPPDCHLIFTTRYAIPDLKDSTHTLPLGKMGYAEQYRLLNYSETLRAVPLTDREAVYRRLDGHPRGYEFLEALMKRDKSFHWAQVSQVETDIFENLLLAKVYERLSDREKALFQVAAVFIARTPLAALAAVSGEDEADLRPVLQSLQDWSLCFLEKEDSFEVHRLTREWMAREVTPTEKVKGWALGAGEYFKAQPTWNDEILAKDYFEMAEAWEAFANTSFNLQNHYQLIGLNQQAFELNRVVLEKDVEEKSVSIALFNMGAILKLYGQNGEALKLYEQSLEINRKIGDHRGEGATLNNISQIYAAKGDYDTSLQYLKQSLTITQQIGNREGEGEMLGNIGQAHLAKGDYDTALQYLQQSLAIMQQIGDRKGEGVVLNDISQIYSVKGDNDTALDYLQQSLTIIQQIGDRKGEAASLGNIGQLYLAKGDYDTALQYLQQSLVIMQQIGDRKGEGVALNSIGQIHAAKGNYDTALRYLEQSLVIQQQIGDRQGEGATLSNIGQIYLIKRNYYTALKYLEQSLVIQQQIGDIAWGAVTLNNLGIIYLHHKNDVAEAVRAFMGSYQINQQLGSPNIQYPAAYLNAIIERIGEAKFQEILSQLK